MTQYLTAKDLAESWKVSERTARKYMHLMPCYRTTAGLRVRAEDAERWISNLRADVSSDAETMDFLKDLLRPA